MEREFKYDAFISYRHAELDKFVAENLHKELEAFHLPRILAKKRKGKHNKIERVFRDKEELPLTSNLEDPIMQALQSSEWLIVICSPRLRESLWCKKEIETFVALRGREHVLAVLVEGEPSESFPDELLYRIEEVEGSDGTVEEVKIPVEPLAADVRGKSRKEVLKNLKTEMLRILAAMFGLSFDDLRQRHRERKMRRIVAASLLVGTVCLLFGIYSTLTAMRIHKQKEQIEIQSTQIMTQSDEILKQNEEIKSKSDEILQQSKEIAKQNEELALKQAKALAEQAERYLSEGNRDAAVKTALEALTESDGIAMPYTTEAEMILAECLRVYDIGQVYKPEYQYVAPGRIDCIKQSYDLDTLAVLDDTGLLTLLDANTQEIIAMIPAEETSASSQYTFEFLGEDRFLYINKKGTVNIYNLSTKTVEKVVGEVISYEIMTEASGTYFLVDGLGSFYDVYDGQTYEKICTISDLEGITLLNGPYIFPEGLFLWVSGEKKSEEVSEYKVHFVDINTKETISEYSIGTKTLKEVKIKDGVAYMLLAEYAPGYMDCDCYTVAVSVESGKLLWENVQKSQFPRAIQLPGAEDADILLSAMGQGFQLIHMETGEVVGTTILSSNISSVYRYTNNGNFLIFCENGSMHLMGVAQNLCVDMSDRFECVTTGNGSILQMKDAIVSLKANDNTVNFYTAKMGPEVQELSETVERTVYADSVSVKEAYEIALSYGLENPQYVRNLFHSDDKKYCFVEYWDDTLIIYEVGVGICTTITDAKYVDGYISAGNDGNSYLLALTGCYMLNADMQPVGWIDKVKDVDVEKKTLYMYQSTYSFSAPIYSIDELIEMAKEWK